MAKRIASYGLNMSENREFERVELRLARVGGDLWPALEAAQYTRVINHDKPANEQERLTLEAFLSSFSSYTESWEKTAPEDQAAALKTLDHWLDQLKQAGLFVHWGAIACAMMGSGGEPSVLPMAILNIGRDGSEQAVLRIPRNVFLPAPGPESRGGDE